MKSGIKTLPVLLFGVATSDHQSEAFDANRQDIRDQWEREMHQTPRGSATDFWNRFGEDVRLARDLGCKIFRFSVAWSRVEPNPGEFDQTTLDHYRQVVAAIREAEMLPLITLHHLTWPIHVQNRGGLTAPDFPRWFGEYTRQVLQAVGPGIPYWITFNEPNLLVYGHIKPWWQADYAMPPGAPPGTDLSGQLDEVVQLMRNLFTAHELAREVILNEDPEAKVGTNPFVLGLPTFLQWILDQLAAHTTSREVLQKRHHRLVRATNTARRLSDLKHCRHRLSKWPVVSALAPFFGFIEDILKAVDFLTAISNSDWWQLGMAGKLPFLCPASCTGKQDFVGFDYYWGINNFEFHRISQLLDASMSKFADAPVDPPGLLRALKRFHRMFPDKEILIVENGCIDSADGFDRASYIAAHIAKVREARRVGVPVTGHICWSITSNREWGLSFGPSSDFGLYHIELDSDPGLIRKKTQSAETFAALIHENQEASAGVQ